MRHLLDTYIRADDSEKVSAFDDMSLIDLIVVRGEDAVDALPEGIRKNEDAMRQSYERENREALRLVENIDVAGNASLRYEVADIQTWAHLGLHLAEKLRGAVALQRYRTAGGDFQTGLNWDTGINLPLLFRSTSKVEPGIGSTDASTQQPCN